MENCSAAYIRQIRQDQKTYFDGGETLSVSFRKEQLRRLKSALKENEKAISEALWTDLHKSYEEAYITEIGLVYGEIDKHLRHLSKWSRPKWACSPISILPAWSKVMSEPLGNTLIIAPWNYPVQLLLNPLVGAISAGCTAVLKPSPYVPHVSLAIEKTIREAFPEKYIAITQGDRTVNTLLLEERWDLIFFTGSPTLGKRVMTAAAKNLTPVVLELGGKSPCIVDQDANLSVAAKRIAWGKLLNAGQTRIAPDYLMLHTSVKEKFLEELKKQFTALVGENPEEQKHFAHIVSAKAFERLVGYLNDGKVIYGGQHNAANRYLSPTLLDEVSADAPVMQEEIFGPIFPIQTFGNIDEAIQFVNQREKPLALYYFGKSGKKVLRHTSSGGACVNDTIMHIVNGNIPFGGVGQSGMSSYHGEESFRVFSHRKSVVTTPTWIDLPFRYMPYKLFGIVKRLI